MHLVLELNGTRWTSLRASFSLAMSTAWAANLSRAASVESPRTLRAGTARERSFRSKEALLQRWATE